MKLLKYLPSVYFDRDRTSCPISPINRMLYDGKKDVKDKINYGKLHHINMFIKVSVYGLFNLHDTCVQELCIEPLWCMQLAAYENGVLEASSLGKFYGL